VLDPTVDPDRLVTHPGEGHNGGSRALGPVFGEGLEVFPLAQCQLGPQFGRGDGPLATAGVPADLCKDLFRRGRRAGAARFGHHHSFPRLVRCGSAATWSSAAPPVREAMRSGLKVLARA
jgi:hypothetical protein